MDTKTYRTIDGQTVVIGMVAWDYDLQRVMVIGQSHEENGSMWYDVRRISDGRTKLMSNDRLWVRSPTSDREPALPAIKPAGMTQMEWVDASAIAHGARWDRGELY